MDTFWTDPQAAGESAAAMVDLGYTAVKFDPAGPYTVVDGRQPSLEALDRTEAFVRLIREAVGGDADLLVGTHAVIQQDVELPALGLAIVDDDFSYADGDWHTASDGVLIGETDFKVDGTWGGRSDGDAYAEAVRRCRG